jgi:REP element-mobilizing transposase RayT
MARIARIKAEGEAFYHVVSRIANKAFLLNDAEKKRVFVNMMHRAADFSGVDVITYVVMDNHFHLCVKIPEREGEVPESEILRRVGVLYGKDRRDALERRLAGCREEGDDAAADAELARLRSRMGDLSEFMKTFKQRVSQWYNSNYGHEGTLWGGRFKSVLVEDGRYLRNLAAYIHGNPIRAGLVARAADYEWSAPGAAAKGDIRARKGLSLLGVEWGEGGFAVRDGRFVNGVIIGSRAFVGEMASRHSLCFGDVAVKVRQFVLGMVKTCATHGQRSTPADAA